MHDVPFKHPAWIEVDLVQFKKNLHLIKQHIGPNTKLCLPVKANAYGHGLIQIAKAAIEAKVDSLAVSCLQEGILLRAAGIQIPILVLGAIHSEQISAFMRHDLEFTIASMFKAKLVAEECRALGAKVKVHLEVDTGMNRTGVRVETAGTVIDFLLGNQNFIVKGVYSHLATADSPDHPFIDVQIQAFLNFVQQYNLHNHAQIDCHLANSAGTAYLPATHLNMVRPGLLAYGYYPRANIPVGLSEIKPCIAIKAKVAYFKTVLQGQGVSYNHTFTADKNLHLITIPIGYGDGLRRALSNQGSILLNGKRYPMVGNICMDQFMVNIGEDEAYVSDVVTIIGIDQAAEISVQEHSQLCATIPYEILCGFNNRLPRLYYTEEASVWE